MSLVRCQQHLVKVFQWTSVQLQLKHLGMSSVALSSSGVENHNRRLQYCEMVSGCTLTKELHRGFYSLKGWRLVLETEHARRKSNNNTCLSIDLWSNSFESISESLLTHLRLQAEHGPCPCLGCTRRWVRWVWWDVSSTWWRSFSGYWYNCSWSILEMSSVALSSSGVENHNRRLQDCEMVLYWVHPHRRTSLWIL